MYDIAELNPGMMTLKRSPGGVLTMEADGVLHMEVLLYRTFPLSMPTQYISVRTAKGDEIGIINDIAKLQETSRREAERELALRYLVPIVTRIDKIKQSPGMWIWHLETTMGTVALSMRNLYEHIQSPAPGRLLLTDMDGNRCEIADMDQLDAHSKKQLQRIL